jgi:hypothetical protein
MKNGRTAPVPTASIADQQMDRGCACSLGGCKFNPFESTAAYMIALSFCNNILIFSLRGWEPRNLVLHSMP